MPFATSLIDVAAEQYRGPLLIALVPQGPLPGSLSALDARLDGALNRLYASGDFRGKKDETAILYPTGDAARVLLVGIGKEPTRAAIRRGAAVGAKRARILGVGKAALVAAADCRGAVPAGEAYQVVAE